MSDSEIHIRPCRPGDEQAILALFQKAFHHERSPNHWNWKFLADPFGGPFISTAWVDDNLAGHYAGYPVPFRMEGKDTIIYQVGDTMTDPAFRDIGRGRTNILARTTYHFYDTFCKGKIPFFYGFNTGKIHRFGKLFLRYEPVWEVGEWILDRQGLDKLPLPGYWQRMIRGYNVDKVKSAGEWADAFFESVAPHYGWLVARNAEYLQWRYCEHPDIQYDFWVIRRRRRIAGWMAGLYRNGRLHIGDALFSPQDPWAMPLALRAWLDYLRNQGHEIAGIRSWFTPQPLWWIRQLKTMGFRHAPEPNNLIMVIIRFTSDISPKEARKRVYFTWGDSDLF